MIHVIISGSKQKVILYDILRDVSSRQFASEPTVRAKSGFSTHIVPQADFLESTREMTVSCV